jgi:hypothetical protein
MDKHSGGDGGYEEIGKTALHNKRKDIWLSVSGCQSAINSNY